MLLTFALAKRCASCGLEFYNIRINVSLSPLYIRAKRTIDCTMQFDSLRIPHEHILATQTSVLPCMKRTIR